MRDTREKKIGVLALLAVAGAVDALLFLHAGGLLAVYMTGNTSKLGLALAKADLGAIGPLALVLASFLVMTTAAAWLRARRARRTMPLALTAGFLAMAQLASAPKYSLSTVAAIAAAAGALNQVLASEAGVTFVTGTLVMMGRSLAAGESRKALGLAGRWVAFLAGAILATAVDQHLHAPVLGLLAAVLAVAALGDARLPE